MKITVQKDNLAAAFAACARASSARGALPAYASLRLDVENASSGDAKLTITGGDGENWVRRHLAVVADSDGTASVPAHLAADTLKDLPGTEAVLEVTAEAVKVAGGKGRFKMSRSTAEAALLMPAVEGDSVTVDAKAFSEQVRRVAAAAARDMSRPALTGVRIETTGGKLTLAATDSYRLASGTIDCVGDEALQALVPAKSAETAIKVLDGADKLTITVSPNAVKFQSDDTTVVVSQVAGAFPAWRELLKKEPEFAVTASTDELLSALRRVGRYGDVVSITFSPAGEARIASTGEGGDAEEGVACTFDGTEDLTVKFVVEFLTSGLTNVESDQLSMRVGDGRSPAWIKGEDRLYLAMPRP